MYMLNKPQATSGDDTVFKKIKSVDTGTYLDFITSFSIKNDGNVYLNKNRNEEIPLSEVKREFIKDIFSTAGEMVNGMESLLKNITKADIRNTNTIIAPKADTLKPYIPLGEYKRTQEKLVINADINIDDYRNSGCVSLDDYEYMKELERTGYYGADQGIFKKDKHKDIYDDEISNLMERYNMSTIDAVKTADMIDATGACSFAALINNLERQYRNNPKIIEETLGIPLYKYDNKGYKAINSTELLADLFIKANSEGISDQEKALFRIDDKTGQTTVINDNKVVQQAQPYLKTGVNMDLIEKTLESSDGKVKIEKKTYNKETSNIYETISSIQKDMTKGYECSVDFWNNKIYYIYDEDIDNFDKNKNKSMTISAGHSAKITGITKDGFIVSSWGERMYILYDDLKDRGDYHIHSIKIDIE